MPAFRFDIVTMSGKAFSGNVSSLMIPGEKGYFGVLANHAALISTCVPGKLKIKDESGNESWFQTGKGFFEVVKNKAVFLSSAAVKIESASGAAGTK